MRAIKAFIIVALLSIFLVSSCSDTDPITDNLYSNASYIRIASDGSGGYWNFQDISLISSDPGGSGATLITPNISSLGGYKLDAIAEYVYFNGHICNDWDNISNAQLCIIFEVNVDNTGGLVTDTVKIQLEVWDKIEGELGCTVQSLQGNTIVGQSDQHEMFIQTISIPNIRADSILSFRINLNTIQSQVTDIIVNEAIFRYPAFTSGVEIN